MSKKQDPLTQGDYHTELTMYVRFHGLSVEEAVEVMRVTTSHADRDNKFAEIISAKQSK